MIKIILTTIALSISTSQLSAQEEPATRELNCFNKWSIKFDERGAEDVKDGVYTDVIITSRVGAKANPSQEGVATHQNRAWPSWLRLSSYEDIPP